MNEAKRAYDLLRGYINREWDRISQVEWADAARELILPSGEPKASETPAEAAKATDTKPATPSIPVEEQARQILGVTAETPFADIRKAYEKLIKRSDEHNFEAGTPDAEKASALRQRVAWAYAVLTQHVNDVDKRFGSLEIE